MEQLAPFTVAVPEEVLTDLRARLERTRFIDDFAADEWTYGVSLTYLRELCDHWRTTFDWRAQEAILNGFDQLETHVDGQHLHLIHARSPNPAAMPLLLVHGWPGSIFEFVKVIGPLSDPAAHGGDPADAFHVVAPSIPGYGFSGPTTEPGWGPVRIAAAFAELMERLGYGRYGAAGGDWGAIITTALARADGGRRLSGLHLTMPLGGPPEDPDSEPISAADQRGLDDWAAHQAAGTVVHVRGQQHPAPHPGVRAQRLSCRTGRLAGGQVPVLQRLRRRPRPELHQGRAARRDHDLLGDGDDRVGVPPVLRARPRAGPHALVGAHRGPDRVRDLPSGRPPDPEAVGRAPVRPAPLDGDAVGRALPGAGGARAPGRRAPERSSARSADAARSTPTGRPYGTGSVAGSRAATTSP